MKKRVKKKKEKRIYVLMSLSDTSEGTDTFCDDVFLRERGAQREMKMLFEGQLAELKEDYGEELISEVFIGKNKAYIQVELTPPACYSWEIWERALVTHS